MRTEIKTEEQRDVYVYIENFEDGREDIRAKETNETEEDS